MKKLAIVLLAITAGLTSAACNKEVNADGWVGPEGSTYSTIKREGYTCEYTALSEQDFLGDTHKGITVYSKPYFDEKTKTWGCAIG